jgi:hypothetical protein
MDWMLNRPRTYTNESSGYSFVYPGGWKKVDPASLDLGAAVAGLVTADFAAADGATEEKANHVLVSGSMPSMGLDWATACSRWRQSFSEPPDMPSMVTMSAATFADTTVGGKPALSVKMTLSALNESWNMDMTIVQNGSTFLMMVFMYRPSTGSPGPFEEVLRSTKFTSRSSQESAGDRPPKTLS